MGQITRDQSLQIMAVLAVNCNWDSIDFVDSDLQDLIVRNQKEAGRRFTAFLRNGGRITAGELRNIHRVTVDRTRTAKQVIDATGRKKWLIDEQVLAEMPLEGRVEDDVDFFELDYNPTPEELDHEYEVRGRRPDPAAVAKALENDPSLADERPIAVQWRDKHNRACYALFLRFDGKRGVLVSWYDSRWNGPYRFGGVRK